MRILAFALPAAVAAAGITDRLPTCQKRCYVLTADLVGCGKTDYVCHCAVWDSRFAPQLSSCMIEGCAFGDDGPTMSSKELKKMVCELAAQSSAPSTPSAGAPTGKSSTGAPSRTASPTSRPQKSGETAPQPTSKNPNEAGESRPKPTSDDGGDGYGGSPSAALSVGVIVFISLLGYLVL